MASFRFGLRMLGRNPGFSATAVVVLALGIGANSAMFSLVNSLLLKPTLVQDPASLVGVFSRDTQKPDTYRAFSYPNFADLRANNNGAFRSLAAHNMALVGITHGEKTQRVFADLITSNYFATQGVPLYRGRSFTAEEERPGAAVAVAIVSYRFWHRQGWGEGTHAIRVNGHDFTVVGVTPEGFTVTAIASPEVYLPLGVYESVINDFQGANRPLGARDNHALLPIGRLAAGVTQQAADARLAVAAANLAAAYPGINRDQALLARPLSRISISTEPRGDTELGMVATLLLSMSALVLLVASFNVANMMLARAAGRRREIAVRLALGASKGNILRQLFAEGMLLAAAGGAAGLAAAWWGTSLLVRSMSAMVPFDLAVDVTPDIRVLLATLVFCLLSTVVFAMGPARAASKEAVAPALKGEDRVPGGRGAMGRLFARRNVLVMSQLALSLVSLSAAGLFVRGAMAAAGMDPGFQISGGVVAEVDGSLAGYDEARGRRLYPALVERVRQIPGVTSASLAATVPFGMISLGAKLDRASDAPASRTKGLSAGFNIVGADYFRTLDIPVLRGRGFEAADEAKGRPAVAVLDKTAADNLWPDGSAIGRHVRLTDSDALKKPVDAEVVGIVRPVVENILGGSSRGHVYVPFGQDYQSDMSLHVKFQGTGPEAEGRVIDAVRDAIRATDGGLPLLKLQSMRGHMEASVELWLLSTAARLFGLFGMAALLMAAAGLYAVRTYTVTRRTREIGIRMAVGASTRDAVGLILREGLAISAVAAVTGLALSLATGRLLAGLLYRVSANDPLVLGGAAAVLVAVSMLACWLPARRAARVQPMTALRTE